MPDDIQAPDATGQMPDTPAPNLGTPQAATPQLAQQGSSGPRPILMDLIQGLVKPRMQASAPGQPVTPVSRAQTFENFLGNFVYALGQGFANEGHGPGAGFRGAGAAASAPLQLGMQQQQQQSELAQRAAQTAQTQQQTAAMPAEQAAKIAGLSQQPRFDPATKQYVGNMTDAQYTQYVKGQGAAQVSGKAKITSEQLKIQAMTGQIGAVKPSPDGGWIAYNKFGQPIGPLAGSVDPTMLTKVSGTTEYKEDKDGNIVALPKVTTSRLQPNPNAPGTVGGPAKFPQATTGGTSRIPKGPAPTGGGPRVVMQGKSAGETGYAFNPQSGETEMTTRSDAAGKGFQDFRKATAGQIETDRQLNNRLADVATKLTRYEDTLSQPLSLSDKNALAQVLGEDKFKVGVSHVELPVDFLNKISTAVLKGEISPDAQKRLVSYYNARESMVGYQRVLSGGARSNEKAMQLNLDALPNPIEPESYGKEALRQFKENLNIAGQGLPKMPGITRASDVLNQDMVNVQIPGQAPGKIHKSQLDNFRKKYPAATVLK